MPLGGRSIVLQTGDYQAWAVNYHVTLPGEFACKSIRLKLDAKNTMCKMMDIACCGLSLEPSVIWPTTRKGQQAREL